MGKEDVSFALFTLSVRLSLCLLRLNKTIWTQTALKRRDDERDISHFLTVLKLLTVAFKEYCSSDPTLREKIIIPAAEESSLSETNRACRSCVFAGERERETLWYLKSLPIQSIRQDALLSW